MIALNIESLTDNCHVLVECIYRETFKMIGESDSVKNNEEDYSKYFQLLYIFINLEII
jgi:hypothetical protein